MARMIIVDEDSETEVVLSRFFGAHDHDVVVTDDVQVAQAAIESEEPDLLFVELDGEEFDGKRFLAEFAEDARFSEIISIGIVSDPANLSATALGVDELVGKPFNFHELADVVDYYLDFIE